MKIAFFHEVDKGGARRSVIEFGRYISKKHTVDLYYVDDKRNKAEDSVFDKSHFYSFKKYRHKGNDVLGKLYSDTVELIKLNSLHRKIARKINNSGYDVVFVEPSKFTQSPFILKFIKIKKVYYAQESLRMVYEKQLDIDKNLGFPKNKYEMINRFIRKLIDSKNIHSADVVLTNSLFTKRNISKNYSINSTVQYMGVDAKVFHPMNIKKDIDVLFVGSYEKNEGYELVEEIRKSLGSTISFKILAREFKWIDNDNHLCKLYNRSKIVLSLSNMEPFGLIPLEVMSSGSIIVARNKGGYLESIRDKQTGFLVRPKSGEVVKIINKILSDKILYKTMSSNTRSEILDNWTWKKRSKELENRLLATFN